MAWPVGVNLCTITFGGDNDFEGNPVVLSVTVKPSHDIVWKATGQRFVALPINKSVASGDTLAVAVPVVDQTGWADGNGNDLTFWYYTVTATYANSDLVTKNWQPITGQTSVDFDMLVYGPVTPGVTAPSANVASLNGLTGGVTIAGATVSGQTITVSGGGGGGSGTDTNAVHYTADTPTSGQQTQARTNLGLGSAATQPTSAFDAAGAAASAQTKAVGAAAALAIVFGG